MVTQNRPRYVDTSNAALAIDCPRCGLITARFLEYCNNCGYQLWPSGPMATAAFLAWRDANPARAAASRYSLALPETAEVEGENIVDYDARAHDLGLHIFMPYTPYPIVICAGMLLLGLSAALLYKDEPGWLRIALAAIGALVFLYGVFGWVVREDVRIYPSQDAHLEHPEGRGH